MYNYYLEPCALTDEFQHFIPDLIKLPYFVDPLKEGIRMKRGHKTE
jgi:hypothetical protein